MPERRVSPNGRSIKTRTSPQLQRDFPAFRRNWRLIVTLTSRAQRSRARCSRTSYSGHVDSTGRFRYHLIMIGRVCPRSIDDANGVDTSARPLGSVLV